MKDLLKEYRDLAKMGGNFRGLSLLQHAKDIGRVIARHRAATLLDYGSGAGDAYRQPHEIHRQWGINKLKIRCYDPSFPKLDRPVVGQYDGVICSDVLEHVPEGEIDALIRELFDRSKKFVWASVCCRPAKKAFRDGVNLHVTLHGLDWWRERFELECRGRTFYLVETP